MADDELEAEFQPTITLGSSGLKEFGGVIDEEFLRNLRGRNAIKTYNEMISNSPAIAAALHAIKMLIGQVEWRVEPADESDAAKAEAEDTESALEDMSHTFDDLISEALSMIWAGFAPMEIVYKIRRGPDQEDGSMRSKFSDGKFGWRKIEIRAQDTLERWVFDDDGGLDGMIQNNMYGSASQNRGLVFMPIEKMLLFRVNVFKGNPEGKSMLRPAVVPYWFTKRIQEFEAIGIERNLAGMPVMEVPAEILNPNAAPELKALKAQMEQFITQVRMDERYGGLVPSETKSDGQPSGWKFKLMSAGSRSTVDTDLVIKRYRGEMLMLFMAQFLTMGTENVGSYSLSSNMTNLFGTSLGALMDSIAIVINRFMIPRRQRLNGVPAGLDPKIEHGDIEGPELEKVAAYITALAQSGMIGPNPVLERRLLEIGDLPQPPDEESGPATLSENTIDSVSASGLGSEHVKAILEVNKALKNGQLDRPSALATIAAALGIDVADAEKFVPDEVAEEPKPPTPVLPAEGLFGDGDGDVVDEIDGDEEQ